MFADSLNARAKLELQTLTNYMNEISNQLVLPLITDENKLSVVRKTMKALAQFRELETSYD